MTSPLMQSFSLFYVKDTRTGHEWRPKLIVIIALYTAIAAFGYFLSRPIAGFGIKMELGVVSSCVMTFAVIVGAKFIHVGVQKKNGRQPYYHPPEMGPGYSSAIVKQPK